MNTVASRLTPFGNDLKSPDLQQFYYFKLHVKQMPTQHNSLLDYTLLSFPWELPDS
jgi:hypothetical protein